MVKPRRIEWVRVGLGKTAGRMPALRVALLGAEVDLTGSNGFLAVASNSVTIWVCLGRAGKFA
jgi:hypothetical protein